MPSRARVAPAADWRARTAHAPSRSTDAVRPARSRAGLQSDTVAFTCQVRRGAPAASSSSAPTPTPRCRAATMSPPKRQRGRSRGIIRAAGEMRRFVGGIRPAGRDGVWRWARPTTSTSWGQTDQVLRAGQRAARQPGSLRPAYLLRGSQDKPRPRTAQPGAVTPLTGRNPFLYPERTVAPLSALRRAIGRPAIGARS